MGSQKTDEMNDLRSACLNCQKCALASMRTQVVFGVGNPDASVMLVGEGPGENEDKLGEPFVGLAGKLLDKMFAAVHLNRYSNLYLTNIVKCRPPKNRDPHPEEQLACMGYLERQLEIVRPKILVCLGRIAACKMIDEGFRVTKDHGQWFEKNGMLMMGMFHPAAVLRNPASKPDAFADFLTLRNKIREVCPEVYREVCEEPPV